MKSKLSAQNELIQAFLPSVIGTWIAASIFYLPYTNRPGLAPDAVVGFLQFQNLVSYSIFFISSCISLRSFESLAKKHINFYSEHFFSLGTLLISGIFGIALSLSYFAFHAALLNYFGFPWASAIYCIVTVEISRRAWKLGASSFGQIWIYNFPSIF